MMERLLPSLLAALLLAGCASPKPPPLPDTPSAAELDAMTQRPRVEIAPPEPPPVQRSPLDDPSSAVYRKVIYFDYDASEIKPQYTDLLRAHANYIFNTPSARVTLEGHSDERGTREYNLALGERRSQSVQRFLMAEGAPAERLSTLSYGEERPADPRRSESAWQQNRRVELVY
jgi:peptidoglycan-associated lipoprotein